MIITYFIKTETDPTSGTNYTVTGTSQILSVPYAFYAEKSGNLDILLDRILRIEATLGVSNVDSNSYQTVKIGTQIWMAENLKTTKYNDGTDIPNVMNNSDWAALTSDAFCWSNNDEGNKKHLRFLVQLVCGKYGQTLPGRLACAN